MNDNFSYVFNKIEVSDPELNTILHGIIYSIHGYDCVSVGRSDVIKMVPRHDQFDGAMLTDGQDKGSS